MRDESRYIACCDLGGTKVLLGLVDETGYILVRDRYLWPEQREPGEMVASLVSRLESLIQRAGLAWENITGVGCSVAATLDAERDLIHFAPNLVGPARDVPFKALLQGALDRPVLIEMDAYATALGEAWQGAGAGANNLVYVVIGTGVGAGLLIHGQLYRGWTGTAGEFGHNIIDPRGPLCNCGNHGCLEALVSG